MVNLTESFSGYSTNDIAAAAVFYGETLGVETLEEHGMLTLHFADGHHVLIYPKGDGHVPATFTVLNFPVDDVAATVAELRDRGVEFERYEGTPGETDEDFVFRKGGPEIAWFTDPAGNVLSIIAR
jgi:catechol 2,3-dioxygenase-like lactoylglutathione lyase family enzyme